MYFTIFIIMFFIQLFILLMGIIKKNYKYYVIVSSCIFPFIIPFCILANIYENVFCDGTFALSETIYFIIKMYFLILSEVILYIVAIIGKRILLKNSLQDIPSNKKIVNYSIIITIFVTLISFGIIFFISMNNIKISAVNYLNDKYGDNGFKIIEKKNDYSEDGFTSRYLTGYNIKMKDNNNNEFNMYIDNEFEKIYDEYLLTLYGDELNNNSYYKYLDGLLEYECKKLNNSLFSKKYNLKFLAYKIDYLEFDDILSDAIPKKYNKIPNINETKKLVKDYVLTHNIKIKLYNKYNTVDEYEKYFESVARAINEYYNDISYFESDVEYMDYRGEGHNEGYFIIDNDNIYINAHGNLLNKDLSKCKKINK